MQPAPVNNAVLNILAGLITSGLPSVAAAGTGRNSDEAMIAFYPAQRLHTTVDPSYGHALCVIAGQTRTACGAGSNDVIVPHRYASMRTYRLLSHMRTMTLTCAILNPSRWKLSLKMPLRNLDRAQNKTGDSRPAAPVRRVGRASLVEAGSRYSPDGRLFGFIVVRNNKFIGNVTITTDRLNPQISPKPR